MQSARNTQIRRHRMKARINEARRASPETLDIFQTVDAEQQRLRLEMAGLGANVSTLQRDLASAITQIQNVAQKIEDFKKPNYHFYTLVLTLFALGLPLIGLFVTFYTQSSTAPILRDLSSIVSELQTTKAQVDRTITNSVAREQEVGKLLQTVSSNQSSLLGLNQRLEETSKIALNSVQNDSTSMSDRAQLNNRVKKLEEEISRETADRRSDLAALKVQQSEVETQVHTIYSLFNTNAQDQSMMNAILFNKTHPGEFLPQRSYYPPPTVFKDPGRPSYSSDGR